MEDAAVASGEAGVEESLFADPTSFSFYQAVRLLERLHLERTRVGTFTDPHDESVRFSAFPSIAFPASEIQTLSSSGSGAPSMAVNFFGVVGPQGVLPYWYTLLVAEQLRARNPALQSFLDIFQHRIVSHLYRAWAKPRSFVQVERGGRDAITRLLRAIVGLRIADGERGDGERADGERRRPILDETMLLYSGFFGPHRRSAIALQQLISDYFGVQAEIEEYVGGWYAVPDESLCRVGESDATTALGIGTVVGDEVWDPQVRARIRLGPLTRERFAEFLPGGADHHELRELTRLFAGDEYDFELRLVLTHDEVPSCVLGEKDEATALGWTTWLRTVPFDHDADDTTLTL